MIGAALKFYLMGAFRVFRTKPSLRENITMVMWLITMIFYFRFGGITLQEHSNVASFFF